MKKNEQKTRVFEIFFLYTSNIKNPSKNEDLFLDGVIGKDFSTKGVKEIFLFLRKNLPFTRTKKDAIFEKKENYMLEKKTIAATILMAGLGERFASDLPKQFHKVGGKEVYLWTLSCLLKIDEIDRIILVTHPSFVEKVKNATKHLDKRVQVIAGGATRQESSFLGVKEVANMDIIIVHDGARPFVSERIIKENIKLAIKYGAVDTCIPSSDTIIESFAGSFIDMIKERKTYFRGQTPQTFSIPLLLQAHEEARKKTITNASDDCQLVLGLKHPVAIIAGEETNIKITTPVDIYLADQLLRILKKEPKETSTDLSNKTFAVVGGSKGIGKEVVLLLKKRNAQALSLSRTSEIYFDLCDRKNIQKTFEDLYKKFGPLDGLINSGGFLQIKRCDELSLDEIDHMLSVNLLGLIHSCKAAKIKKGGSIINLASSSFTYGREGYSIYSAAKAAVVNFTQSLAEERKDLKINCVVPSRTNTEMRRINFPDENPGDLLDPVFVAQKIVDVICDDSLTGSIIDIKRNEA